VLVDAEWGYNAGPMPREDEIQHEIDMIADEPSDQKYPTLNDINYFLHDLNLLYELTRVLLDPKYENVRITQHFEYRNHKRIDREDQLTVARISKQSPLDVSLGLNVAFGAFGAAAFIKVGGLQAFVDLVRSICTLPTDIKMRRAELESKQLDNETKKFDLVVRPLDQESKEIDVRMKSLEARRLALQVERMEAATPHPSFRDVVSVIGHKETPLEKIERHLEANPIRLRSIELKELPRKKADKT
jgi:hypothetical protein